jgi:hypothetical protein
MKSVSIQFLFLFLSCFVLCFSCKKDEKEDEPPSNDDNTEIPSEGFLTYNGTDYEIMFVDLNTDTIIGNKTTFTLEFVSYDSLLIDTINKKPEDITWGEFGEFFRHLLLPDVSLVIELESPVSDTLLRGTYVYNGEVGEIRILSAYMLTYSDEKGFGYETCELSDNDKVFISESLSCSDEFANNDIYVECLITLKDDNFFEGYYNGNVDLYY